MQIPERSSDHADFLSTPHATAMLHTLVTLIGDGLDDSSDPVTPPEHLILAIRAAPGPVLRGLLVEVVEEVGRRQCRGDGAC